MIITYDRNKLNAKAEIFCQRNHTRLTHEIGFGTQGIVFRTAHNTALKVYDQEAGYHRERNVYKRLKERNIQSILGMSIPRIEKWDDELYAFEMSIVHVPCVLDFGGAYLDNPPDHMLRDETWLKQKEEEFGDNWPKAQAVIRNLEHRAGLYLVDVNTGNIKF